MGVFPIIRTLCAAKMIGILSTIKTEKLMDVFQAEEFKWFLTAKDTPVVRLKSVYYPELGYIFAEMI